MEPIMQFDLTSAAGVAGLTVVLVQILKTQFFNKDWVSYGLVVNVATAIVAFGVAFGAMIILPDLNWKQALANGTLGLLTTLGGYEWLKNLKPEDFGKIM